MDPRFKSKLGVAADDAWDRLEEAAVGTGSASEQVFYAYFCFPCVPCYTFYDEVLLFIMQNCFFSCQRRSIKGALKKKIQITMRRRRQRNM